MTRTLARLALIPVLMVLTAIGCSSSDPIASPPVERTASTEQALVAFATGSLVIPMDTTFQDSGMLKAFGLVYKLLSKNVPVSWVVQTGKTQGGVDFVASGKDLKTNAVVTSHGYRGGPFVIDSVNRAAALPIIQAWQAANTTTVHDMTAGFSADVQRVLAAAPRIAVFVDGNEDIAFTYLNAAGVPDSLGNPWPNAKLANYTGHPDVLTEAQVAGPTAGGALDGVLLNSDGTPAWCQLTSMHYNPPGNPESIREVRGWLSASANTHAYMECAATETFENSVNGHFLTTLGITNKGNGPNPVQNLHPDSPFAQYDGSFTTVGGSVAVINLVQGSTLYSADVTLINLNGDPPTSDVAWMTGHIDGVAAKGKVSYLVGHQYPTSLPISQSARTNGVRLFLDSLFETDCASQASQPTISITKSAPSAVSGNSITYTISYGNAGPGIANNVTLVDPIPTGTTFVSATNSGTFAGGNVTWNLGNLSVNESGSVSFIVSVAQDGTYSNQAKLDYVVGVTPKEQASNTTSTTRGAGGGSSDLSLSVTGAPNPVAPGGTITYSVSVTNAGPDPSGTVTVTDTIPAGSTFSGASGSGWTCTVGGGAVTCTHAAIASGGSAPLSIAITAPTNAGTVTNTISVASPTPDPTPGNNTATTTTSVQSSSDLSVSMTASPNPVAAGATLTYSVTIANAGPSASGTVTYVDTLPAGTSFVSAVGTGWTCSAAGQTLTCTNAGIAAGAQAPLSINVTAPATPGSITNTGTVSSSSSDPSSANNTASVTTTVGTASSDVSVTVSAVPDPVVSGGTISYAVDVSNAGPSPSGTVTVSDTLPTGTTFAGASGSGWTCTQAANVVTCTHAAIAPGGSAPLTIDLTAPSVAGTVTNTVVVNGTASDPSPGNNTATVTTTVSPPPGADLSIAMTASPNPVGTGGNVAYAVDVQNAGPASSGPITVTDPLPMGATFASASGAGWTCTASGGTVTCTHAALASGGTAPLTINLTAPGTPGTMTNTVTVSSTSPDPSGINNTATTATIVTGASAGNADLSTTVNATPNPVQGGGTEIYQITISNAGPNTSGPITFVDTLPSGATLQSATGTGWTCAQNGSSVTCTHAALADGESAALTLTVTAPQASGTMTNTANATSTTTDPNDLDNTVITTTTVNGTTGNDAGADGGGGSDLSVTVTATPNPVPPGGTETYTITATNSGPDASGVVTVTDTLPSGATFVGASGAGWTCTQNGNTVTCTHAPLGDGESSQVQIQVRVPSASGMITNTATVGSTSSDPNGANNTVATTTTVGGSGDGGACGVDSDCGGASSGIVCDGNGSCVSGCRGQGGNGCPTGQSCTSTNNTIGQCVGADGGGDGGVDSGGESDGGLTDAGNDASLTDGGDASLSDSGNVGDGGRTGDAGPGADAAPDTGSFEGGGCDCTTSRSRGRQGGLPVLVASIAIGFALRRRRRC